MENRNPMTLDSLLRQISSAPTPHDLYAMATSPKMSSQVNGLQSDELERLADAYDERYEEVRGRYKIAELDGIPLRVRSVEQVHNENNGTNYLVITGERKDTDEPFSVRTSAKGICQWMDTYWDTSHGDINPWVDVVFLRIEGRPPYNPYAHWSVRRLVPASHDNPFTRSNGDGTA